MRRKDDSEVAKFDPLRSVHYQESDPGVVWQKDEGVAVDLDPTSDPPKVLTPNVIRVPSGGYRMYYTGLNMDSPSSFDKSQGCILSACSSDGFVWQKESGVRLDVHPPGGALRVLCPDVVPLAGGGYRMYFEARAHDQPSNICSALSEDGLHWQPEPGIRFGDELWAYGSPRCIYLDTGCRLYCHHYSWPMQSGLEAQNHIVSATSPDGLNFSAEAGVRIAQESDLEDYAVYAPEVIRLGTGGYRMYYSGWTTEPMRGRVFSARSEDGLTWIKDPRTCVDIGGLYDRQKASEPCVIDLDDGRFRLYYEACDAEGKWRILSATNIA